MGPRLVSRGDPDYGHLIRGSEASMGPRLVSRGDKTTYRVKTWRG